MNRKVLIVEDNDALRRQLTWALPNDMECFEAKDRDSALMILQDVKIDLIILDLHLPPEVETAKEGREIFERAKKLADPPIVIVITGDEDKSLAFELIEEGVFDYIFKPIDPGDFSVLVKRAVERKALEEELKALRREMLSREEGISLIGESREIKQVFSMIEKVAPTDLEVLIIGESGTGKELVARAIHRLSRRKRGPFIPVDCGAIPQTLAESELFGHEKGAFTGATTQKPGRFEMAHRGTLFLDEIGNLPLELQAKLLRVIEEKVILHVGGKKFIPVDARLISASNRDLREAIESGQFRGDLYFRLNTFTIVIPPLRERKDDILILARHFLQIANQTFRKSTFLSQESEEALLKYHWPGNVRELKHVIEQAVILCEGEKIAPNILFPPKRGLSRKKHFPLNFKEEINSYEKELIELALKEAKGNRKKAAELLSIDSYQLKYLIKKHGIKVTS